jgi:hypothetical protein
MSQTTTELGEISLIANRPSEANSCRAPSALIRRERERSLLSGPHRRLRDGAGHVSSPSVAGLNMRNAPYLFRAYAMGVAEAAADQRCLLELARAAGSPKERPPAGYSISWTSASEQRGQGPAPHLRLSADDHPQRPTAFGGSDPGPPP